MSDGMTDHETITAISTPPGRGGIGIVRLSGPEATRIAEELVRLRHPLEPERARLADVMDVEFDHWAWDELEGNETGLETAEHGELGRIDEALVTWFKGPHSYTGEDVVEIAAHGSPVVLEMLLRRAIALGARLAEPGEFTQRAFLAGRLDLTQAEAVRDLIEAQTMT
jgi:tRNA modification GTPase